MSTERPSNERRLPNFKWAILGYLLSARIVAMRTLPYANLPQGKLVVIGVIVMLSLLAVHGAGGQTSAGFTPPGPNLALGKSYTLDPSPNYDYCTDPGDNEQLTDGKAAGYQNLAFGGSEWEQKLFWVQTGCVGCLRLASKRAIVDSSLSI